MDTHLVNVGIPAILVAFAVFAASRHLSRLATLLAGVVVLHFAFAALWPQLAKMSNDATPILGEMTVATMSQPGLRIAGSCARVWIGFSAYMPFGNEQIAGALRWMIGGTA